MILGKKIYRNPNNVVKEPHYVVFTADTIERIRNKFHAKGFDNNVNLNHDGIQVENTELIHSFLLTDLNRKGLPKEFLDLPNGKWMIAYKVENEEAWEKIKDKKLNGFSVEGRLIYDLGE